MCSIVDIAEHARCTVSIAASRGSIKRITQSKILLHYLESTVADLFFATLKKAIERARTAMQLGGTHKANRTFGALRRQRVGELNSPMIKYHYSGLLGHIQSTGLGLIVAISAVFGLCLAYKRTHNPPL